MNYLAAIILCSISMSAFAYDCGSYPFRTSTTDNGEKIGLFAEEEYFVGAPKWEIGQGEPPLQISEAISIISTWANQKYIRFDSMEIRSVQLQERSCLGVEGDWFYVIELDPVIDGNKLFGGNYTFAVTMSGEIIEPTKINE